MAYLDQPYTIERDTADLYVEQVGPEDAPAVYYLHGGPGYDSFSFRDLNGEDLEQYRMIYADQRGSGRSYASVDFGLNELVQDVLTTLDALKVEKTTLLAHGFGALIAVRAAVLAPLQVERLVLVNPWFSMPMLARAMQREAAVASGRGDQALPPETALADGGADLDPEEVIDQAFEMMPAQQSFAPMQFPDRSSPLRVEHSDSEARFGPHASAMPHHPCRREVTDELELVKAPTVIMGGKLDRTSFPEQVELGLERVPGALFSMLDSGHYPWLDSPDEFLEVFAESMKVQSPTG